MGNYLFLQTRRLFRLLAVSVSVTVALALALYLGAGAAISRYENREGATPFSIGIVGAPDSGMLAMGLSAIGSFDDLGLALQIRELTAQQAPSALAEGMVDAYVVIPEDFTREALHGNILTIQYVTTPDPTGMTALFQKEITDIIGDVLLTGERASFGAYAALAPELGHDRANRILYDFSLELAQYILIRNRTNTVVTLGVGDAPGFSQYLCCGLAVTALLLLSLTFAPLTVQRHLPINRMLLCRSVSPWAQSFADLLVLLLGEGLTAGVVFCLVKIGMPELNWEFLGMSLPALAVITGFCYLCCSASAHLGSCVLVCFFGGLSMALASGCLYPAWFFPEAVQRACAYLPTALARRNLTGALTGDLPLGVVLGCLGYSAAFFLTGGILRARRIRRTQEVGV